MPVQVRIQGAFAITKKIVRHLALENRTLCVVGSLAGITSSPQTVNCQKLNLTDVVGKCVNNSHLEILNCFGIMLNCSDKNFV